MLAKNQAYKGHETLVNRIKMELKMYGTTFLYIFLLQNFVFLIGALLVCHWSGIWVFGKYMFGKLVVFILTIFPGHAVPKIFSYGINGAEIAVYQDFFNTRITGGFSIPYADYIKYFAPFAALIKGKLVGIYIISLLTYTVSVPVGKFYKKRANKQVQNQYIRGAKLEDVKNLKSQIRANGEETSLSFGPLQIPRSAEVKHCLIVGRPGVGKTVCLSQILERMIERKQKIIVYDSKGDYLSKFYDPARDIIFNPLDVRSGGWSVFREISTRMDIDAVAHSLIPKAYSKDAFWNDAARDVFAGILYYLFSRKTTLNEDIWNAVTAPGKDIAGWLKNTTGGERGFRYIEDASSKQAMSVYAVMMQYVKSFEFMAGTDGDFTIDDWLAQDKGGTIFITSYRKISDTLRPILSLFIDLMAQKLLSLKDDYDRRIYFMLDEFPTLQRLSSLVELLTLSRSKGGSVWLGTQDLGQIAKKYGQDIRDTIVNACGNSIMFAVADPHSADYLSQKIGETEYLESRQTYSMGVADNRDGISLMESKVRERLILPSQIASLPDLNAFVKIANYNITKTELKYRKFPDVAEPIIIRQDLNLEEMIKAEQRAKARNYTEQAGDSAESGVQYPGPEEPERTEESTVDESDGINNNDMEQEQEDENQY